MKLLLKKINKFYFTFIIVLFISSISNGQNDSLIQKGSKKNTITFNEGIAYKMLYENQKESNNNILSTIFYALGGLGAAVFLVFGSTWWFNEKKVKDLLKELDDKVQDIKSDSSDEISKKMNELIIKNNKELSNFQTQIKKQFIDEFKNFADLNNKAIVELKNENNVANSNYQELLKSYNENLQSQITSITSQHNKGMELLSQELSNLKETNEKELKKHSKKAEKDNLKHIAEIAVLKGNANIALMAYLDYALFLFHSNSESTFEFMYDEIIKCLEKVSYIYDDEDEGLETLMKLSIKQFPDETKEITDLYKTFEVRKL